MSGTVLQPYREARCDALISFLLRQSQLLAAIITFVCLSHKSCRLQAWNAFHPGVKKPNCAYADYEVEHRIPI